MQGKGIRSGLQLLVALQLIAAQACQALTGPATPFLLVSTEADAYEWNETTNPTFYRLSVDIRMVNRGRHSVRIYESPPTLPHFTVERLGESGVWETVYAPIVQSLWLANDIRPGEERGYTIFLGMPDSPFDGTVRLAFDVERVKYVSNAFTVTVNE